MNKEFTSDKSIDMFGYVWLWSYFHIKGEDRAKTFTPFKSPEKSCIMLGAKQTAIWWQCSMPQNAADHIQGNKWLVYVSSCLVNKCKCQSSRQHKWAYLNVLKMDHLTSLSRKTVPIFPHSTKTLSDWYYLEILSIMKYACTREQSFDLLFSKKKEGLSVLNRIGPKVQLSSKGCTALVFCILLHNKLHFVRGKSDSVFSIP